MILIFVGDVISAQPLLNDILNRDNKDDDYVSTPCGRPNLLTMTPAPEHLNLRTIWGYPGALLRRAG